MTRQLTFPDIEDLRKLAAPNSVSVSYDLGSDRVRVDVWTSSPNAKIYSQTATGAQVEGSKLCLITDMVSRMVDDIKSSEAPPWPLFGTPLQIPAITTGNESILPTGHHLGKLVAKVRIEHHDAVISKLMREWADLYPDEEPNVVYNKGTLTVLGLSRASEPGNILIKAPVVSPITIDRIIEFASQP